MAKPYPAVDTLKPEGGACVRFSKPSNYNEPRSRAAVCVLGGLRLLEMERSKIHFCFCYVPDLLFLIALPISCLVPGF